MDTSMLDNWIGKTVVADAHIAAGPARLMAATLDREIEYRPGDPLPAAWHWLYFHESVRAGEIGDDGHPRRGGFLPPVQLPRRMWAAGRLQFAQPLRIGDDAERRSCIQAITAKSGRSGQLCFVEIEHEVTVRGERRILEVQTLVYREAARGEPPPSLPAPVGAAYSVQYTPDPVLLFRYSALTFNGHRIHYDVDYCRQVEGYPGLVVHGPLVATLLLDQFEMHYPEAAVKAFEFRARSPLFSPQPFVVHGVREGDTGRAWATNHAGGLAMEATLELLAG